MVKASTARTSKIIEGIPEKAASEIAADGDWTATNPRSIPQEIPFPGEIVRPVEQVAFLSALFALFATVAASHAGPAPLGLGVGVLAALSVFYVVLARRWETEWLLYLAQATLAGSYLYYRSFVSLSAWIDVAALAVFCGVLFGLSEYFEDRHLPFYATPALNFAIFLALLAPLYALARRQLDEPELGLVSFSALFYSAVCWKKEWKKAGYVAGILYNAVLWMFWIWTGWKIADQPQLYLVPVGFSAILFAEVNREQLGLSNVKAIRSLGSLVIALSTAVPIWQFQSFGSWLFLLVASLGGIFAGMWLRVQTFVWMGLFFFVADVAYQLIRPQQDLLRPIILIVLSVMAFAFVARLEKYGEKVRAFYATVREWE